MAAGPWDGLRRQLQPTEVDPAAGKLFPDLF